MCMSATSLLSRYGVFPKVMSTRASIAIAVNGRIGISICLLRKHNFKLSTQCEHHESGDIIDSSGNMEKIVPITIIYDARNVFWLHFKALHVDEHFGWGIPWTDRFEPKLKPNAVTHLLSFAFLPHTHKSCNWLNADSYHNETY